MREQMMRGQLFPYPLYTQNDLDSGALMMKCVIGHRLREEGLHHGTVMLGERFVAGFVVEVSDTSEEAQATIDLSELHGLGRGTAPNEIVKRFEVKTGGYLVLHVGHGEGGYHVLLRNTSTDQRPWNSQRLKAGDIFSAIPLRPGSYSLSNVAGENTITTTRLVVTYPDPRDNKKGRPRPQPIYATFHRQSFDPEPLEIRPGQGIVIATKDTARFMLTLEQPDDGSDEIRQWHEQQRAALFRLIQRRRVERVAEQKS